MERERFEHYQFTPEYQFDHPMEVDIPAEGAPEAFLPPDTIKIYDVVPQGKLESPVPVLMIPGWTGTAEGLRENMIAMAKLGRRALSVTAPHGITPTSKLDEHSPEESRKGAADLKALEIKQISQVDGVSHSRGSIRLIGLATVYPEIFRNLVLVSPAGLMGRESWLRLLTSFTRDMYEQYSRAKYDPAGMEKMKYVFRQIIDALKADRNMTLAEVQSIIRVHLEELLINLKEQGHGIIVISPVDDREFPTKRLAGSIDKSGNIRPGIVTKDMFMAFGVSLDFPTPRATGSWVTTTSCLNKPSSSQKSSRRL